MSPIAIIDPFSGIAGDMMLGALLDVGLDPEWLRALLNAFGSVQGVKDAGVEEIAKLPGFSAASAQRLLSALLPPGEEGAPIATLETAITNVANDHEARTDASTEVPADESLTDQG